MNATLPTLLLDRVTTGTSVPWQVAGSGMTDLTFTFTSAGTTSGGTILIEESDVPSYTGTWSEVYSEAASAFTGTAKQAIHRRIGAGMWVRVRVSSTITGGGTASVTVTGA
jgi:hypothetical protein